MHSTSQRSVVHLEPARRTVPSWEPIREHADRTLADQLRLTGDQRYREALAYWRAAAELDGADAGV